MELPKRPMTMAEYNELKRRICLSTQKLKDVFKRRNTFGDMIKVTDEILVYEGDKLRFASKGHIVNQGLIHMINAIAASTTQAGSQYYLFSYNWTSKTTYMRLGTGGNVTTGSVTSLTTPVATAPEVKRVLRLRLRLVPIEFLGRRLGTLGR